MKKAIQVLWLISGVLAVAVLLLGTSILLDVKAASKDMQELWDQVTIEDVRQGLNLIEKQLDNETLALEIEQQLSLVPLEDTPETWEAFLDFCGRTGYVSTNPDNYLRFRYGKLKP